MWTYTCPHKHGSYFLRMLQAIEGHFLASQLKRDRATIDVSPKFVSHSREVWTALYEQPQSLTFLEETQVAVLLNKYLLASEMALSPNAIDRAQLYGSAYRRILRLRSRFPACVQASNFCASLVSVECLVTRRTHAQKPKFTANPRNTLAVSTEFPAKQSH